MEREEVIQYLADLSDKDRRALMVDLRVKKSEQYTIKRKKGKSAYQRKKERDEKRGEEMKEKVKPGMFVYCEGTKDGIGFREVLEVDNMEITARKLEKCHRFVNGIVKEADGKFNKVRQVYWVRAPYITTHYWDKVKKIVNVAGMEII